MQTGQKDEKVLLQSSGRPIFFLGSMKYQELETPDHFLVKFLARYNFFPDRNTRFTKIPLDRKTGWIRKFSELRMGLPIKTSELSEVWCLKEGYWRKDMERASFPRKQGKAFRFSKK